jgi:hypothetical protein
MTQPSGWPERDEAALIPQSPRLERVPEDAQPASSKATFSSAAGLYDAAGTQARAQDARVDWSADLASRQRRPPAESRIHSLVADSVYAESMYGDRATQQAETPSAAAESLVSWCQRLGVGWLAKTFEQAGHWTVSDLIRADHSDAGLRAMGVSSLSERHIIVDALADDRRDGISMDIITSAISSQSLETRFDAISRASERELAEQQMRQAHQQAALLPSIERQRQQQKLGGGAARLEVWLQPLDLHPGQRTVERLRRAGINAVERLL